MKDIYTGDFKVTQTISLKGVSTSIDLEASEKKKGQIRGV